MKRTILFTCFLLAGSLLTGCGQSASAAGETPAAQFTAPVPFTTLPPDTPSPLVATAIQADQGQPLTDLQEKTPTPLVMPGADVVVQQFNAPVSVRVGQTIFAVAPVSLQDWDVEYDPAFVAILSPSDPAHLGDSKGWLLRAIMPGTARLSFTSLTPICEPGHPCPAMPTFILELILVISP